MTCLPQEELRRGQPLAVVFLAAAKVSGSRLRAPQITIRYDE